MTRVIIQNDGQTKDESSIMLTQADKEIILAPATQTVLDTSVGDISIKDVGVDAAQTGKPDENYNPGSALPETVDTAQGVGGQQHIGEAYVPAGADSNAAPALVQEPLSQTDTAGNPVETIGAFQHGGTVPTEPTLSDEAKLAHHEQEVAELKALYPGKDIGFDGKDFIIADGSAGDKVGSFADLKTSAYESAPVPEATTPAAPASEGAASADVK